MNGHAEHIVGLEQGMDGVHLGGEQQLPDLELHRVCAEGSLEQVRAVLSRSLEHLETLGEPMFPLRYQTADGVDGATGCTPIVLAIRNGHHDVVRELLTAGAIVPPPGLTQEPMMLSILYPQPLYGFPPQFMGSMGVPPQEFYGQQQNGFYPDGRGMFPSYGQPHMPRERKESSVSRNERDANLPPVEVAKTIPCRNFPNCKYGANCVFYHPVGGPYMPNPVGMRNGFSPSYEQAYGGFQHGMPPYFQPQGYPSFPQDPSFAQSPPMTASLEHSQHSDTLHQSEQPTTIPEEPVNGSEEMSHTATHGANIPVVPFQPQDGIPIPSDAHLGVSPLSPSALASSLPSIPPPEAFFATSPSNGGIMSPPSAINNFVPMAPMGANRRTSFNQGPGAFGIPNKPFGHTKKPSFSGGPRPPRPGPGMGSWKDGNPPPCAFFGGGKCRNGEFCKFPHLDENGNDVRHPDVVRGVVPPLPTLGRQHRNMRNMHAANGGFGAFEPNFRPQPLAQGFVPQHQQARPQANGSSEPHPDSTENGLSPDATLPTSPQVITDLTASVPTLPSKPAASTPPLPTLARSASQPGVQRVHVAGFTSRAQSPAPSNVSFHGNGHPKRAGRGPFAPGAAGLAAAPRGPAVSQERGRTGPPRPQQRVPGAEEFPALGNGATSPSANSPEQKVANGGPAKTAAQILSAPAPYRPVAPKKEVEAKQDDERVSP